MFSSEYLFIMNLGFFAPVINSSTVKEGSILWILESSFDIPGFREKFALNFLDLLP